MATAYDPTQFDFQNFYSGTLTSDITSGSLTINLDVVPSPAQGILVIDPNSTTNRETIFYTSKGSTNITCPSDGRGWNGSTATSHLTGTTVIMADVAGYFQGLRDGTLSNDPLRALLANNFVVSGGVISISAGLTGAATNITFYLNGRRYTGAISNHTYTASQDTYVDVTGNSDGSLTVTYNNVANNATAPALSANYIRLAKVVTNGTTISTITQYGNDGLGNAIYPNGPSGFNVMNGSQGFVNLKSASNSSGYTPTTGDNNMTSICNVTFTVAIACVALVTVAVGLTATSDSEFRPEIWLDNVLYHAASFPAASFTASGRAIERSTTYAVPLQPGSHTLGAGVFVSGGGGYGISGNGSVEITAVVFGKVTA